MSGFLLLLLPPTASGSPAACRDSFGPKKLSITSDVLILYVFFHLAVVARILLDAIGSAEFNFDQMIFS